MSNQPPALTSSPIPSLMNACNPFFCDGIHARPLTPIQFEEQAKLLIQKSRSFCIFQAMTYQDSAPDPIRNYIQGLSTSDLATEANEESLQKFVEEFKPLLPNSEVESNAIIFLYYMISVSDLISTGTAAFGCHLSWREQDFSYICAGLSSSFDSNVSASKEVFRKDLRQLRLKGWKDWEIEELQRNLVYKLSQSLSTEIELRPIWSWIKWVDQSMTAKRFLQYSETMSLKPTWGGSNQSSLSLPFVRAMQVFWEAQAGRKELIQSSLAEFKETGDSKVEVQNWSEAINYYGYLNFFGQAQDSPILLQSLANSAALRLRLSTSNSEQLPFAILKCTLALQTDPNHVKALFRRGLALALCRKWNEAIVDFERAVELDPLSPAKKELEVARRQVTRRIGN